MGFRGRFDVPGDERCAQGLGHFFGQHGFPGAGFTLNEQRAAEEGGSIDGDLQVVGGNIRLCAFKAHGHFL